MHALQRVVHPPLGARLHEGRMRSFPETDDVVAGEAVAGHRRIRGELGVGEAFQSVFIVVFGVREAHPTQFGFGAGLRVGFGGATLNKRGTIDYPWRLPPTKASSI